MTTATTETAPGLMALEFSDLEHAGDSPELAAFKLKVVALAKRHSRAHHCGGVAAEMRELGIREEQKVKVTVMTSHPFTFNVNVRPSQLAGKTAAEQAEILAGVIGKVKLSVGDGVSAVGLEPIVITAEHVVSMERWTPPVNATVAGVEIGDRDGWRYTSNEGRVLHLFRNLFHDDGSRSTRTVSSECRDVQAYAQYLTEESDRGENRHCQKCVNRANGVPATPRRRSSWSSW